MEFTKLALYIENHGLGIIITVLMITSVYKYFVPFMKESIETQKEMRAFMQNFNTEYLKGKGLELMLFLKTQQFRWLFQRRVVQYIADNNIAKNWEIIIKEIDLKIEEREYEIYLELRDIIDKQTLESYLEKLNIELRVVKELIITLLDGLKTNGGHDKTCYDMAQRAVKTHFEHFENRMHSHIKKLLD